MREHLQPIRGASGKRAAPARAAAEVTGAEGGRAGRPPSPRPHGPLPAALRGGAAAAICLSPELPLPCRRVSAPCRAPAALRDAVAPWQKEAPGL